MGFFWGKGGLVRGKKGKEVDHKTEKTTTWLLDHKTEKNTPWLLDHKTEKTTTLLLDVFMFLV
jgi:hypothetical protein